MKKLFLLLTTALLGFMVGCSSYDDTVAENNKIYYTTTDGQKLFPNSTEPSVFGAIFQSNIYENGQGVLTFDDAVTLIRKEAFRNCTSLTSITIPDSVTSIGEGAFAWCTSLINFQGKFASNDGRCLIVEGVLNSFAPAGLTTYTISDSVTSIGNEAFSGCYALTNITIPDGVTSIGNWAFSYCDSLTSVTIGNGVTSIGGAAFWSCTSLTSITIPDSVTSIGEGAFWSCTSLTSIIIPDSVTSIGKSAFSYCTSLKEVYCKPTTPPTGYPSMFDKNASGLKIYVPTASVDAYKAAEGWSYYADAIVGYDF